MAASTLMSLVVKLGVSTKDFDTGLSKARTRTKTFITNIGKAIAKVGLLAGVAAVGFGALAVKTAADAEEMMSKLDATFGAAGKSMISELDAFAAATGRSRFELRGAATDMGAVLKALGFTEEAASELAASATMMATDIGAFNNLPTAEVAQKIQRAYTGEFESLKSLGIVINQAKVAQELLNMGFEGGIKEATDYQKAMAINAIMVRQTADAQGTAAAESQSFTGRMVALKAALKDTTTEIGTALLPIITPLMQKMAEFAQTVLPPLVVWFEEKLVPALVKFGAYIEGTILPVIQKFAEFIKANMVPIFAGLVAFVVTVVVPAFIAWATAAIASAAATIAAIAPIAIPILAVIAVVKLLSEAWKKDWGGIRTHLTAFWNNTMRPIGDKIKNIFAGIGRAIRGVIGWVRSFIDKIRNIRLPSWLTPGSATPFEIGLWGIADALKTVSNVDLPQLGGGGGSDPTLGLLREIADKSSLDEVRLSRMIRDAVLQAVE